MHQWDLHRGAERHEGPVKLIPSVIASSQWMLVINRLMELLMEIDICREWIRPSLSDASPKAGRACGAIHDGVPRLLENFRH